MLDSLSYFFNKRRCRLQGHDMRCVAAKLIEGATPPTTTALFLCRRCSVPFSYVTVGDFSLQDFHGIDELAELKRLVKL